MRLIAALFAAALMAACGFTPMYATGPSGGSAIGPVNVGAIDGRAGHVLRTELTRILAVEEGPGASQQLEITLNEQIVRLALRLDESASRAELRLRATYVLTPTDGGRPIRGALTTIAAYNIPTAAFGAATAQDDARERAAEQMAERIRADLALRLAEARRS